ncbi:MAG TPA: ATP-binding cassette domain-containing protein [Thermoanaerobaculia bacterium]
MSVVLRDVVLPLAQFTLEVSLDFGAPATALYGPSGAGKTSVLELIAGLRTPRSGRIELHGRDVTDLPPRLRRVGYVPQDDALFPHMSVRQNVFYASGLKPAPHVLDVLEIAPLLDRNVKRLSGGERKRVALARALLSDPEILLLDEPLSGVDVALRDRVLAHLVRVRVEFPIPTIYVTHQMAEVEAICDEIVRLERGHVMSRDRLR